MWINGLVGLILLVSTIMRFFRLGSTSDNLDRVVLLTMAGVIVVFWAIYLVHVQGLNKLPEEVDEKVVARLSRTASSMCLLGYMLLLEALFLTHGR